MTTKQNFNLFSVMMIYTEDSIQKSRNINVMSISDTMMINRGILSQVQFQATQLFESYNDINENCKIVDIIIMGIFFLGCMTQEEFHEGFADYKPENQNETNVVN